MLETLLAVAGAFTFGAFVGTHTPDTCRYEQDLIAGPGDQGSSYYVTRVQTGTGNIERLVGRVEVANCEKVDFLTRDPYRYRDDPAYLRDETGS